MGLIGCPETSKKNCHYKVRNVAEERRSQVAITWSKCSKKKMECHSRETWEVRGNFLVYKKGHQAVSIGIASDMSVSSKCQDLCLPSTTYCRSFVVYRQHYLRTALWCVVILIKTTFLSLFDSPSGPRLPLLDPTFTLGRTPLDGGSARRRDLYLTTYNTDNRRTSVSPAGFEITIPASEWPQTHTLDRAATLKLHIIVKLLLLLSTDSCWPPKTGLPNSKQVEGQIRNLASHCGPHHIPLSYFICKFFHAFIITVWITKDQW